MKRWNVMNKVDDSPYNVKARLNLASEFVKTKYHDLACGEAYMALLLCDEWENQDSEFHEPTFEANNDVSDRDSILKQVYLILTRALYECGDFEAALEFGHRAISKYEHDVELKNQYEDMIRLIGNNSKKSNGYVRREVYEWNTYEPERSTEDSCDQLNAILTSLAPKLQVKISYLPLLNVESSKISEPEPEPKSKLEYESHPVPQFVPQLGLFAKEDLHPNDIILNELSLLTANSQLNDEFCDACAIKLSFNSSDNQRCEECYETVFCSSICHDAAQNTYHPAICDSPVTSIAKDVPKHDIPDALYTLLLFRTFAMAITQSIHPLQLACTKYIWGDFNATDPQKLSLPFSFKYNILLPLNFLEHALDNSVESQNIFTCSWCHVWVFNSLLSKFRGTAAARNGPDGKPEIAAVHPMWCLANHSCDPNVTWKDWEGGSMKFLVKSTRVEWEKKGTGVNEAGVKKGDEILSHYVDLELPVKERREWGKGPLGGECQCERCIWESSLMS